MLCEYGCEQKANYQLKNGKWCCSIRPTSCLIIRAKNSKANKGILRGFCLKHTKPVCGTTYCKGCKNQIPNNVIARHIKNCQITYVCERCGKECFGRYGANRFCSKHCARSHNVSVNVRIKLSNKNKGKILKPDCRLQKVCPVCKASFLTHYGNKNQIYCSRSCVKISGAFKIAGRKGGLKSATIQSQIHRSKNEKYFAELCLQKFKNVGTNIPMFNGWDADVILQDQKIAILWNGVWHRQKVTEKHSVAQVQNRDKIKIENIINCGFKPYIIEDNGMYNKKFVEEEFIKFLDSLSGLMDQGSTLIR